jgi:hypothetical protein
MAVPAPSGPSIDKFATSRLYLSKSYYSLHQIAILKALYGVRLSAEESRAFLTLSEGRKPRPNGYTEAYLICGTRSGKTDLAGTIATYETVRWGPSLRQFLIPGQFATGILIASDRKQAGIARNYVQGNLETLESKGFKCLASADATTPAQSRAIVGEEIRLRWPARIAVYPSNKMSVRGATGLWFIGDEIAWWDSAEDAYNQDVEVIRAVRSRFATLSPLRPRRIIISSPNQEQGVLWEAYKNRQKSRALVIKAPTWLLNPAIPKRFFDEEQEKDPVAFARDYGAEFLKPGAANLFFEPEIIDQCVRRGQQQIPPASGIEYVAWIDAAFKRDRFSLGIAHRTSQNPRDPSVRSDRPYVLIDRMRHWTPTKGHPLSDETVVEEICEELRPYGIDRVHGDQFADIPLQNRFQNKGIKFVLKPVSAPEKTEAFKNLRSVLRSKSASLPDDRILLADCKGLIRKDSGSKDHHMIIMAPKRKGCYDDAANVLARLVQYLLPFSQNHNLIEVNSSAMPVLSRSSYLSTSGKIVTPPSIMSEVY